jgi:Uma2 family endonuclease
MATQQTKQQTEPRIRKWTKSEYYKMGELGFFDGQRAELMEGVILVQSPQKWPHAVTVDRVAEVLRHHFGAGYWVRSQLPLDLGQVVEPEPDVSVVVGKREDYQAHPQSAVLIVEVSDSTLRYDRRRKGSRYAQAAVPDYWIVNLVRGQLEVYRNPQPTPTGKYGHSYCDRSVLRAPATITPLAVPQAFIPVSDLLG